MLTLITLCAVIIGGILYAQTGHQLGKLSLKAWAEEDNDTTTSMLLFPVSHMNGKVGNGFTPIGIEARENYLFCMTCGWPLKILLNMFELLAIVGPTKVARSMHVIEAYEKRLKEARETKRKLIANSEDAEVKLAMLKALREDLDREILEAEAERDVERESRLMELIEARERSEHEIACIEALAETDAMLADPSSDAERRNDRDDDDGPSAGAFADEPSIRIVARERQRRTRRLRVAPDAMDDDDVPSSTVRTRTPVDAIIVPDGTAAKA